MMISIALITLASNLSSPELAGGDFSGIQLLLKSPLHTYSSIADLVGDLPEEFRNSYSLVREGHGLQHSSPEFPRVVMGACLGECTENVTSLLSFHGNPMGAHYDTLEIATFTPRNSELSFQFIKETRDGLKFSQKNPPECIHCHQQNPQLIWGVYPFWPGLFRPELEAPPSEHERRELEVFWSSSKLNSRYSVLTNRRNEFLSDDPTSNPNIEIRYLVDPNLIEIRGLAKAMDAMATLLLKKRLQNLPQLNLYKYALASVFSNCPAHQIFPEHVLQDGKRYQEIETFVSHALSQRHPLQIEDPSAAGQVYPQFIFMFEHLHWNWSEWFGEGPAPKTLTGPLTDFNWIEILREAVLDDDLMAYTVQGDHPLFSRKVDCDRIAPFSKRAFANQSKLPVASFE